MPVKIFISSKIQNLKTERDIAERIILDHKFDAIRSENWGAAHTHTEDTCQTGNQSLRPRNNERSYSETTVEQR